MSEETTYGLRGHTLAQIQAKCETDGPGFPPWRVDTVLDLADALAKLEARVTRLEAERDYAINAWVGLENDYEPSRREPWDHKAMLAEIHNMLGTPE